MYCNFARNMAKMLQVPGWFLLVACCLNLFSCSFWNQRKGHLTCVSPAVRIPPLFGLWCSSKSRYEIWFQYVWGRFDLSPAMASNSGSSELSSTDHLVFPWSQLCIFLFTSLDSDWLLGLPVFSVFMGWNSWMIQKGVDCQFARLMNWCSSFHTIRPQSKCTVLT